MNERQTDLDDADPVWTRLIDQLTWYSTRSHAAQQAYKRVKIGQLAVGAAVPVVAALASPPVVTAALAAVVVVAEGAQQLFQWHTNWLRYRSTAEALKHEKFLFVAEVGRYHGPDRRAVLAIRIEDLVSQENTQWTAIREPHSQEQVAPAPPPT
ncbi:DUF4231 domain-containing protein [Nocardia vinacea]|uniref:DUF4231 domain-containing protein n=1 Tax=Nocardia vinacea TaxID=96468 RepID=UPI0033FA4E2B